MLVVSALETFSDACILLVPVGTIIPVVNPSVLTWLIKHIYNKTLQFLHVYNVIIIETKVPPLQAYHVYGVWLYCSQTLFGIPDPKTFKLFWLPIF